MKIAHLRVAMKNLEEYMLSLGPKDKTKRMIILGSKKTRVTRTKLANPSIATSYLPPLIYAEEYRRE